MRRTSLIAAIVLIVSMAFLPVAARISSHHGPVRSTVPVVPALAAPVVIHVAVSPVTPLVRVRAGDSLWAIAAQRLGDPYRWTQLWKLNKGRVMPGGERFTDADLIRPGWILRLPRRS